ncbi:methyltransferase, FxLD system [Streptomyces sp. NPDC127098]|uniref:methyltransferase, FxLD system n=1 Tax=Streptomyces sp. NPDC127098 TaxID=3347137 RepID=UPI00365A0EE9
METVAVDRNAALVEELRGSGQIVSERVAAAFLAVPRHRFLPGVGLQDAYRNDSVFTKRGADGKPVSSVSAPWLVATMLERLAPRPGDRVLEVGSGGYNAALLRHMVGPEGAVTSQDIDAEVIARAAGCLADADVRDVRLVTGDGRFGVPEGAPYDRLIVTVQATHVEPAWLEQLTDEGRLVVPLRLRGLSRLLTFTREEGHWRGDGWEQCGFVRMRGEGVWGPMASAVLADGVRLRWDGGSPPDGAALTAAWNSERRELWSGVMVGVTEGTRPVLDLWLATMLDAFGRIHTAAGAPPGLPVLPGGSPATWSRESLAYLTMRPANADGTRFEYGVAWHGPHAALAEEFVSQLRVWDRDQRGGPGPSLIVFPEGSTEEPTVGRVLRRPGARMVLTWP